MSDFYKKNHSKLWKNFEIDVLAPFQNDIDMDDPGTISTLFSDYAQREKNNNSEAYVDISQESPVIGSIQFDPERKIVPEVRIPSVPDYGVPMPKVEEDYHVFYEPNKSHHNEKYIERRIRNPDEAKVFDKVVEAVPSFQHDNIGPEMDERNQAILQGIIDLFPSPVPILYKLPKTSAKDRKKK